MKELGRFMEDKSYQIQPKDLILGYGVINYSTRTTKARWKLKDDAKEFYEKMRNRRIPLLIGFHAVVSTGLMRFFSEF